MITGLSALRRNSCPPPSQHAPLAGLYPFLLGLAALSSILAAVELVVGVCV